MKQIHCLGGQFEIAECGEADKVVVLAIIEPTDIWETADAESGGYARCTDVFFAPVGEDQTFY